MRIHCESINGTKEARVFHFLRKSSMKINIKSLSLTRCLWSLADRGSICKEYAWQFVFLINLLIEFSVVTPRNELISE